MTDLLLVCGTARHGMRANDTGRIWSWENLCMEQLPQDHLGTARMLAPAPSSQHFVGEVLLCLEGDLSLPSMTSLQ